VAAAPALLGHLAYSREHEREADEAALSFMRHNNIRPSVMIELFGRLAAYREGEARAGAKAGTREHPDGHTRPPGHQEDTDLLGIAFSSHPPDEDRIAFFKAADLPQP
jgi:Zn-dependent protease with chaperone function